jgi:tetratricopeptide (TPR) repeat protein
LAGLVGAARAATLEPRVRRAAEAYDGERYVEARRVLRPIAAEAPGAPSVRELLGLVHYRLGKWKEAIGELEAFRSLTSSTEQHPVLADCYRALRRWAQVDELWEELREVSPSAELVTEGRIVTAGALADRGQLADAIKLLEKGWKAPKRAGVHHLRRAYALADLYERASDVPRARALFGWVAAADPDFADVEARLDGLG